jgi:hypothetical protein
MNHGTFPPAEAHKRFKTGTWSLDYGLAKFMAEFFGEQHWRDTDSSSSSSKWSRKSIKSMANVSVGDFGAGGGHYAAMVNHVGKPVVHVQPYDAWQNVEEVSNGAIKLFDLAVARKLDVTYDWVYSIEVAEHIPRKFADNYLENLRSNSRYGAIVSWAARGQGGIGHHNELDRHEVLAKFEAIGLVHCPLLTEQLKAACVRFYIADNIVGFVHKQSACDRYTANPTKPSVARQTDFSYPGALANPGPAATSKAAASLSSSHHVQRATHGNVEQLAALIAASKERHRLHRSQR